VTFFGEDSWTLRDLTRAEHTQVLGADPPRLARNREVRVSRAEERLPPALLRSPVRAGSRFRSAFQAASDSITLVELCRRFSEDREKTNPVGAKRDEKLAAARALILRFFGAETPIQAITPSRCA
jgi:hypothetical protein